MEKIKKIGAVVLTVIFLGSTIFLPMSSALKLNDSIIVDIRENILTLEQDPKEEAGPATWDGDIHIPIEDVSMVGDQNDIGYNIDVRNNIAGGLFIYVGEPVDNAPGRGRIGTLEPNSGDPEDWYRFTACEGQTIQASLSSSQSFGIEICDTTGTPVGQSYNVVETGFHFLHIFANDGADTGEYTISVSLSGQNDAGTGNDAGDSVVSATAISPGSYEGYMDHTDVEDWYSFNANSGDGIFVTIEPMEKSDYDIHLYNPSGDLVHSAQFYGDDDLEYPADSSGVWSIKFDMFPGWDESLWPDNYFIYGSGAYEFELNIGGIAETPITALPGPEITPIAKTYVVNDDPDSNKDEYGYLAAVPAANNINDNERYVSPIIYQGVDDITNWFGTVDDTTQYLIDDWTEYLDRHNIVAEEYIIDNDPITAASEIAIDHWESPNTAVLAVDGSSFEDEIEIVYDQDKSLNAPPEITTVHPGEFKQIGAAFAKPMFVGKSYGAMHLIATGDDFSGDTAIITPKYEQFADDNWPHPYDENGPDIETYLPISVPGIWLPLVSSESGLEELQIIQYKGDRYSINVGDSSSSIRVKIETDEESNLIIFLIDPNGNIRRPQIPHWNGGEINPIHQWNGGHWEHDFDDFRMWTVEEHLDYDVEINHPMIGKWTAIVVPYVNENYEDVGFNGNYHITAELRKHSTDRVNAGLSASNAAVIASLNNAPLLYVTEQDIPTETTDALNELGVSNIIFVNIGDISSASPSGTVTEYNNMQDVINAIKTDSNSENVITITSFATGEGYFAPSAMLAAYHGCPVLNIGEASEAYNGLDQISAWEEYTGDYYHGCRALGHLPVMEEPFDLMEFLTGILQGEWPHAGFELKLRWFSKVTSDIQSWIEGYGLDRDGKEALIAVSPRENDIRGYFTRALLGNNSYAGHIPVDTPGFASAIICRDILYPAVIYANPGRHVTSACLMNFRDGHTWECNDGVDYEDYICQILKECGSLYDRSFEGHTLWRNLLDAYNNGVGFLYHCSHGTGGSGICCMYENIEEQFPLAEINHEHLRDFNWWDGWRGYYYDNSQTRTPRWGGLTWFNAQEPNLYDIVHFKWCDEQFENLHSQINIWQSCTTGKHFGPIIYLEHGAALAYGNGNTGRSPQKEVSDQWVFQDMFLRGYSVGQAFASKLWLFEADYTTLDPTTIYGDSTLDGAAGPLANIDMIYGDPTLQLYNPDWIEPVPVSS